MMPADIIGLVTGRHKGEFGHAEVAVLGQLGIGPAVKGTSQDDTLGHARFPEIQRAAVLPVDVVRGEIGIGDLLHGTLLILLEKSMASAGDDGKAI